MSDEGTVREDKKSGNFLVDIWWKGERHRLYRLPIQGGDMVTCKTHEMAETLRYVINRQIDMRIFHPERFKAKKPLHMKSYSLAWLKDQEHLMETTRRDYEQYIKRWINPGLGEHYIDDINEGILDTFVKNGMPGLGPKSKANVLGCVMKILHDAERAHHITKAPHKPVMRGVNKVVDPEVIWVEPEEQEKIIDALDPRYRPLIIFGMLSGVRPAEARALQWNDIMWNRGEIMMRHAFDRYGELVTIKGKKVLPIPMDDDIRELLEVVRAHEPEPGSPASVFVFINERTGKPYNANICKVFARATQKALGRKIGIAKVTRTSYAQQLANAGVDISIVARLLRHSDPRITKRYFEYKTAPLKSAMGKIRRIG